MGPCSLRLPALAACVCVAAFGTALSGRSVAAADINVRPLVKDCDATDRPAGCDMAGPVVGAVRYEQNKRGDLRLAVAVWSADPETTYNVILFTGATYDDSFYDATGVIGTLTTNGHGAGRTDPITVPASTLQDPRFGPLVHTDHLNLFAGVTVLTATGIDYTVPVPSPTATQPLARL